MKFYSSKQNSRCGRGGLGKSALLCKSKDNKTWLSIDDMREERGAKTGARNNKTRPRSTRQEWIQLRRALQRRIQEEDLTWRLYGLHRMLGLLQVRYGNDTASRSEQAGRRRKVVVVVVVVVVV